MMRSAVPVLAGMLAVSVLLSSAGCLGTGIGDISYANRSILVGLDQPGGPADVYVQATIYRITGYEQQEYAVAGVPARLGAGASSIAVPVDLVPGRYKVFVYVLGNGNRSAGIRDIVVGSP